MAKRKVPTIDAEEANKLQQVYEEAEAAPVLTQLACPVCKEEFEQKRFWQKFCSPKCRYTFFKTLRRSKSSRKKKG